MTVSEPTSPALPGRAREARQNDVALLRAAREVFAELGYDAPMSKVAERAEIGVGGIYRRYASKDELVQRLREHGIAEVIGIAESARDAPQADGSVATFLRQHILTAESRALPLGASRTPSTPEIARLSGVLHDVLAELIEADVKLGLVPGDFSPGDVMAALAHLTPIMGTDREVSRARNLRHLTFFLRGLRAGVPEADVEGSATTWDEWMCIHEQDTAGAD